MLRAEQVLKGQAWWALGEFPCSSRGAALCPSDNQGVCAAEGSAQLSAPAQPPQALSPPVTELSALAPPQLQELCALGISLSSPVQSWDSSTNPHYGSVLLNLIAITQIYQCIEVQNSPETKKGANISSQVFFLHLCLWEHSFQ